MSGRIRGKVLRLERRARAAGNCRACGGLPRLKLIMGEDEPAPGPCPACGRAPTVVRIIRAEPPEGWEQRQKERRERAHGP